MARMPYPTDLSHEQWDLIEPWIPRAKPGGRPRQVDMREVINAILYVLRGGCARRLLPHDFPRWGTVSILCGTAIASGLGGLSGAP